MSSRRCFDCGMRVNRLPTLFGWAWYDTTGAAKCDLRRWGGHRVRKVSR